MRAGRVGIRAWYWAIWLTLAFTNCRHAPVIPATDFPERIGCHLTCSNGERPIRQITGRYECRSGARLRGENLTIVGEVNNEQDPHQSSWLAGKGDERGKYLKDDVVMCTCYMFFAVRRGDEDEHQIGPNRGARVPPW